MPRISILLNHLYVNIINEDRVFPVKEALMIGITLCNEVLSRFCEEQPRRTTDSTDKKRINPPIVLFNHFLCLYQTRSKCLDQGKVKGIFTLFCKSRTTCQPSSYIDSKYTDRTSISYSHTNGLL